MTCLWLFQILFNQKSVLLLNSSCRISNNWNLLLSQYINPLLFIIYTDVKQESNSWSFQVITGYHIKIKLVAHWWLFLFSIVNISSILSNKVPKYTVNNVIYLDWQSTFLAFTNVIKQYFHYRFVSFKQEDGTEIFSKTEKEIISLLTRQVPYIYNVHIGGGDGLKICLISADYC